MTGLRAAWRRLAHRPGPLPGDWLRRELRDAVEAVPEDVRASDVHRLAGLILRCLDPGERVESLHAVVRQSCEWGVVGAVSGDSRASRLVLAGDAETAMRVADAAAGMFARADVPDSPEGLRP